MISSYQIVESFIRSNRISKQKEIQDELQKKGINLSQSNVSRLLKRIGVEKREGFYIIHQQGLSSPDTPLVFSVGENLVVIKTSPGGASQLAYVTDNMGLKEIVGTIAGDDTVFIAVMNKEEQGFVAEKIRNYFNED